MDGIVQHVSNFIILPYCNDSHQVLEVVDAGAIHKYALTSCVLFPHLQFKDSYVIDLLMHQFDYIFCFQWNTKTQIALWTFSLPTYLQLLYSNCEAR